MHVRNKNSHAKYFKTVYQFCKPFECFLSIKQEELKKKVISKDFKSITVFFTRSKVLNAKAQTNHVRNLRTIMIFASSANGLNGDCKEIAFVSTESIPIHLSKRFFLAWHR